MDIFWEAINDCEDNGRNASPYSTYVFERISENYRRVYNEAIAAGDLPQKYCRFQLMTDMIAGMTDTYAVTTFEDLKQRRN